MRYSRVFIQSITYELAPHVVTSAALEDRLSPLYQATGMQPGQLEALTGIRERRFWNAGQTMSDGAITAGRKALNSSCIDVADIGLLIYGGVCRDNIEPATACAVADGLGLSGHTEIYDISNACLGVINGIVQIANAIELGYIKAGLVVSCESARQIVDLTIKRMLQDRDMETFKNSLATLTGGSGAVAVLLTDESLARNGHRLVGGITRSATEHHRLCRWGPDTGIPASCPQVMETDAPAVLEHGVALGVRTWHDFLTELDWSAESVDKVICHQVGTGHRIAVMQALELPVERDFPTFEYLGNIGTVSLPITAAIAAERGFLKAGDRVGFLGIGSGLNCVMLGVKW